MPAHVKKRHRVADNVSCDSSEFEHILRKVGRNSQRLPDISEIVSHNSKPSANTYADLTDNFFQKRAYKKIPAVLVYIRSEGP